MCGDARGVLEFTHSLSTLDLVLILKFHVYQYCAEGERDAPMSRVMVEYGGLTSCS